MVAKKKTVKYEKKFILWFSSSFFYVSFSLSLTHTLLFTPSLPPLLYSPHYFSFFFSYFPRQKIDILKTFILSSTFSLFCTNEKWNLFFYSRNSHTHTEKMRKFVYFLFVRDDFNSNYMDILIIYLCIFH